MSVTVQHGDSRALLAALPSDSVDSCVSDPPYELGFMGRAWDSTGIAYDADLWREVYRVLKPGSHLVAFGGTRTYHRMVVAIEDAGFEIRDQLAWVYGSGFPKSFDVSKAIDATLIHGGSHSTKIRKANESREGDGRSGASLPNNGIKAEHRTTNVTNDNPTTPEAEQWQGWGTALKPAWEPICLARKPFPGTVANNVLTHGTGGLNVDACRVPMSDGDAETINAMGGFGRKGYKTPGGSALEGRLDGSLDNRPDAKAHALGRFPANIVHDGSEEVEAGFPDNEGRGNLGPSKGGGGMYGHGPCTNDFGKADSGSAARFFYSAKAGKLDRLGSEHETVKPVDLMRWLVRLVTPPGGTLLDPFAGSGSTGIAAHIEGFDAILMELREEAVADINRRLAYIKGEGRTTAIEAARLKSPKAARKARGGDTPLFAEPEA